MSRPALQTPLARTPMPAVIHATVRRAPSREPARAPGSDPSPRTARAAEVRAPVAPKLRPRSRRMSGSTGWTPKITVRRLAAISQTTTRTSASALTASIVGVCGGVQILEPSGTGLCVRTQRNTSLVASWPPVTKRTFPETQLASSEHR